MNVGLISKTNIKGQLVIPKEMRKSLGIAGDSLLNIVLRGNGIYIYPVKEVVAKGETELSYLKILSRTKGAWHEDWNKLRQRRKKTELKASAKRKLQW